MYVEMTAGSHTYMLKLTVRGIVQLEKDLGYNPLQMFMGIDEDVLPKLGDIIRVLHRTMQPFNHGISLDDTYDIYEDFIQDGHTMWDIIPVLINVFIEAGFLPKGEEEAKN